MMSLWTIPFFSMCFCAFKGAHSSIINLDDENGEGAIGSFYKSAEGQFFSKPGSILSTQTTESVKECCFKCVQNKKCLSVNTIASSPSRYRCDLLNWAGTGFGKYLATKNNSEFMQLQTACSPNPCQNGGECTATDGGTNYTCTCFNHSNGRNCENNACTLNPCQNGGQCNIAKGGADYTCRCFNRTGKNCEKVSKCSPNPCQNGGSCILTKEETDYSCRCVNHTGKNCEINKCLPNPCQNGGECSVTRGGSDYSCKCVNETIGGKNCTIFNCILFDFESGNLTGWNLTGTAFNSQPTYGDNIFVRSSGQNKANLKGDWFVSTYDYRPSPSHPAGGNQGDGPKGTATSPPFTIRGKKLQFLIGGGMSALERVELLVDGLAVVNTSSPSYSDTMVQVEFDISAVRGKEGRIRLVDDKSYSWAIIYVDHFVESDCK